MNAIQTETYKGKTIKIVSDKCTESPRIWDKLGTIVAFHSKYDLSDKHDFSKGDYDSWDELGKAVSKEHNAVILPIYMLDHSGITIATTPFSCPWDSGQVGFIAISREKMLSEFGWKRLNKKRNAKLATYLTNEINIYDTYLKDAVVGFQVMDGNEVSDSCYGYYSIEDALTEARGSC